MCWIEKRWLAALLAGLLLTACTTMRAGSNHYEGADFSTYASFAWIDESPLITPSNSRIAVSALSVRRIREAIERELTAMGFQQTASREQADFAVAFTVGARDLINVDDYPLGYRGRRPWSARYFGTGVDVTTYTEGTLAIDIFDSASRQPVWHGWARKRITGGDIEDPAPTIDAAVRAILAGFPPDS